MRETWIPVRVGTTSVEYVEYVEYTLSQVREDSGFSTFSVSDR